MSKKFTLSKTALLVTLLIPAHEAFAPSKNPKNNRKTTSPEQNSRSDSPLATTTINETSSLNTSLPESLPETSKTSHSFNKPEQQSTTVPQTTTTSSSSQSWGATLAAHLLAVSSALTGSKSTSSAGGAAATRSTSPISTLEALPDTATADNTNIALTAVEEDATARETAFTNTLATYNEQIAEIEAQRDSTIKAHQERSLRMLTTRVAAIEKHKEILGDGVFKRVQAHNKTIGDQALNHRKKIQEKREADASNQKLEQSFAAIQERARNSALSIKLIHDKKQAEQAADISLATTEVTRTNFSSNP